MLGLLNTELADVMVLLSGAKAHLLSSANEHTSLGVLPLPQGLYLHEGEV